MTIGIKDLATSTSSSPTFRISLTVRFRVRLSFPSELGVELFHYRGLHIIQRGLVRVNEGMVGVVWRVVRVWWVDRNWGQWVTLWCFCCQGVVWGQWVVRGGRVIGRVGSCGGVVVTV